MVTILPVVLSDLRSVTVTHMVAHHNATPNRWGHQVNAVASDFAYIASLDAIDGLQVNAKYM